MKKKKFYNSCNFLRIDINNPYLTCVTRLLFSLFIAFSLYACADDQARQGIADNNYRLSRINNKINQLEDKINNQNTLKLINQLDEIKQQQKKINGEIKKNTDESTELKNTQDKLYMLIDDRLQKIEQEINKLDLKQKEADAKIAVYANLIEDSLTNKKNNTSNIGRDSNLDQSDSSTKNNSNSSHKNDDYKKNNHDNNIKSKQKHIVDNDENINLPNNRKETSELQSIEQDDLGGENSADNDAEKADGSIPDKQNNIKQKNASTPSNQKDHQKADVKNIKDKNLQDDQEGQKIDTKDTASLKHKTTYAAIEEKDNISNNKDDNIKDTANYIVDFVPIIKKIKSGEHATVRIELKKIINNKKAKKSEKIDAEYYSMVNELAEKNYSNAASAGTKFASEYSSNAKAPDALRIAYISYGRLGKEKDAKKIYQQIMNKYPNSNAAKKISN